MHVDACYTLPEKDKIVGSTAFLAGRGSINVTRSVAIDADGMASIMAT